jgi:hypothetical protein
MECLLSMDSMDSHVVLLKQMPLIDVTLVFALPVCDLLLALLIQPAILTSIRRKWNIAMTHDIVEVTYLWSCKLVEKSSGGQGYSLPNCRSTW